MMQTKFNFNNFAPRVCHSLAACHRHTPSSLAVVIDLSDNDVISLRPLRCGYVPCAACVALAGNTALVSKLVYKAQE